jgi:cytoskeletal protein CcmA (bactofilin family)
MRIKSEDITVISEKCRLEGKLEMSETVIIQGSFRGSISCSILEIFENGKAVGNFKAENVSTAGYLEGNIACSCLLTVTKTGTVRGKLTYGAMSVELGGIIDAEIIQLESTDTKLIPFHRKGVHSDK